MSGLHLAVILRVTLVGYLTWCRKVPQ